MRRERQDPFEMAAADVRLDRTIAEAKRECRKLKRAAPYLFPEFSELKQAEREYEAARQRLATARRAWRNL